MSKKSLDSLITKGMSWSNPNNKELLGIDFREVAVKTNLTLSEDICEGITRALAEYISQVRSHESCPLSKQRRNALKKVNNACELLESFLSWDAPGTLDGNEFDAVTHYLYQCAVPRVSCIVADEESDPPALVIEELATFEQNEGQVGLNGKNVADYLALCRKQVQRELSSPYFPGRPENTAIRRCLKWLMLYYKKAGGEGRGVNRSAAGEFSGPFLTFAKLLLDKTNAPLGDLGHYYSESALGALIVNKYRLS